MIRLQPRSTHTDTRFPYTTLCRSIHGASDRTSILAASTQSGDAAEASARYVVRFRPCGVQRSVEHTSELKSLMRISYAVLCLITKNKETKLLHKKRLQL